MAEETYTRSEVEYMMKKLGEQVYEVVFRVGYISNEDRRILINRLLDNRR